MPAELLAGLGVLVTRPAGQAAPLCEAIEAAGGTAVPFPTLEIVARDTGEVTRDAANLSAPDVTVFVSPNAVLFGLDHAGSGHIAAIGPATAQALVELGRPADIVPAQGYDSEHLLAEPGLQSVGGKVVRIIRGESGRERIAETLRSRGAFVEYLPVYDRRLPVVDAGTLRRLESAWHNGEVNVVTVMSVESLRNLVRLLPETCLARLAGTPLVTPAARVIKECQDLIPGIQATLADGPGTENLVRAIAAFAPGQSG